MIYFQQGLSDLRVQYEQRAKSEPAIARLTFRQYLYLEGLKRRRTPANANKHTNTRP